MLDVGLQVSKQIAGWSCGYFCIFKYKSIYNDYSVTADLEKGSKK
jgi:hypothetical protein